MNKVQINIDTEPTYLLKVSEIVDRYADGTISMDEANDIAEKNAINITDLKIVHSMAYITPKNLIKLLRELREELSTTQKNELIVQAVIEGNIDVEILDELILTYQLNEDEIFKKVMLKKESQLE